MAFFKIEKSGCCEHKGLCQVRADFYWDEKDPEYKLTECKIYPKRDMKVKLMKWVFPPTSRLIRNGKILYQQNLNTYHFIPISFISQTR